MTNLPSLSDTQRQFGASVSLAVRKSRAAIKAKLAATRSWESRVVFTWALEQTAAQGMKVRALLMALPGIGPKRASALLAEAGLTADRSVRSLGPKQRERVVQLLTRSP